MPEILAAIKEVGFPIFVAGWLLIRTEKIMQANTSAIRELTHVLRGKVEDHGTE